MSLTIVATLDELRLLTKREREAYEKYRHEGKKREQICEEMGIDAETFRRYWWSSIKKIIAHRKLMQNPQFFMAQNKDILGGNDIRIGQAKPYDTGTISNTSKLGREPVAPAPEDDQQTGNKPEPVKDTGTDDELAD